MSSIYTYKKENVDNHQWILCLEKKTEHKIQHKNSDSKNNF